MMVGFVSAAKQDLPAGEASEAVQEAEALLKKLTVDCGVYTPPWVTRNLVAAQALSAPRRRLLRLLQKRLLLQLAADKRGADVDPRRRPPHAATPESILARWISADPKRLVGGVLALGLHGASPSTVVCSTPRTSRQLSLSFAKGATTPAKSHTPAGAGASDAAAAPASGTEVGQPKGFSAAAGATARAVAAVAADPFEASTTCSTTSSTTVCTVENCNTSNRGRSSNSSSAFWKKLGGVSGRDTGWSTEKATVSVNYQRPEGAGGDGGSIQLRTSCVLCLSPFSSVGGSFLCCVCLHTLKNNRRPWGVEGRDRRAAKRSLSSIHTPPPKKIVKLGFIVGPCSTQSPLQGHAEMCGHPSTQKIMQQPRSRFKRSASAASAARQPEQGEVQQQGGSQQLHQQHQRQQDGCAGSVGGLSEAQEVIGWRARAAAAAAAAAEDSSWWSSTDAPGEPPVVPPLLLPLLPSIFCLHARPWPPPPTKKRRILSRRRRGLECFVSPAVASQRSLWGSWLAQREGQGQQTVANTSATGAGAATAYPASPYLARIPAVAEAAVAAAEVAVAERPPAGGELGTAAANGAAAAGCLASPSCSPNCCCHPGLTADKHKPPESAQASGGFNDCYFCSSATSPHRWTHGVVLHTRGGRQSEPAFLNVAAAIPATTAASAAAAHAAAAVRDMAATAAAATLTGQENHEQQTPPPRFRRRSWTAEANRCATPADGRAIETATSVGTPTGGRSPTEGAASTLQYRCCKCSKNNLAASAGFAVANKPNAAGEPLPKAAAGATTAAPAPPPPSTSASCSSEADGLISSRPASLEQADVLSTSHSGTYAALDGAADGKAVGSGYVDAGSCDGIDDKGSGSGFKKALQGEALGKGSTDKGLEKGSCRGLDRGGGIGVTGGCVRYSSLARISQGLLVGGSSLGRGSGLGIYTCREFNRRAVICEYSGILIDRRTALLLRHMECASHVVNVQMQHLYLLGFHTPFPLLGGGAFINDGRWNTRGGEGPGICVRFRVMFDKHRATQRVVVVAVKDIPKGTELLTSYDNDYWRLQKGVHVQRTSK